MSTEDGQAARSVGGWQNWQTVPANIVSAATGVHDLYLAFAGSSSDFVNVNWFTFTH